VAFSSVHTMPSLSCGVLTRYFCMPQCSSSIAITASPDPGDTEGDLTQ
jgi:hypothetical protein